jgi:SAM-dependent methyltransferase
MNKKELNSPSKYHHNRRQINWLLYDITDKYLIEFSKYYKGRLVDLGCGTAPYKEFFLQYADSYMGVDWSESIHEFKGDVISNLNEKINLEDDFADTIVSLSVMEHLYNPEVFLSETYRVLKDDGVFVLGVPWMWWIHEAPHDYYRYTSFGLKHLLQKAGFSEVEIIPTSGFFTTIFIKMNYFSVNFLKGSKFKVNLLRTLFRPFWFLSQKLAPYLDKYDKDWNKECQSYFVIAKK